MLDGFLVEIHDTIPVANPGLIYGAMLFKTFFWRLFLELYGMLLWTLIGMLIEMIIVMLIGMLISIQSSANF